MSATITIAGLISAGKELKIALHNSDADLTRKIMHHDVNRPGLALAGFYDYFAFERIQVIGNGEWAYLNSRKENELENLLSVFFSYDIPCLIFTCDHFPPEMMTKFASEKKIPILKTQWQTNRFISELMRFLEDYFVPSTTLPGVLVEVFGVGVMLTGKSGVGKSETALELLERGHRLVADDAIELSRRHGRLYGQVSEILEHHMEIRGLGIINIRDLFGAGSVRKSKRVDLVIQLEDWQAGREYDRIGIEEKYREIMEISIPEIIIPVKPGRNIPILVETAAKLFRLKQMGYNPAKIFDQNLRNVIDAKSST